MSLLVLLVLAALAFQISVTASTDARITRNDVTLTVMDNSIESALLQIFDKLKLDGEGGGGSEDPSAAAGAANTPMENPEQPAANPAAGAAGGQQEQSIDSRRDEWATPQRTDINEIKLRILIQDEDSKYNVLNLLNPDEKEAEAAFNRVVRILDLCREGTMEDIDERVAQEMARAMLDHMTKRKQSSLPRPKLLTDDEKAEDRGFPLSLREFGHLKPFEDKFFMDYRDEDGKVVHSIESFLTVWNSLETASELQSAQQTAATGNTANQGAPNASTGSKGAGASSQPQGSSAGNPASSTNRIKSETNGYAVNLNTAPVAVLKGLFDDRELSPRFWDEVVKYRNLEEEKEEGEEEEDPEDVPVDEYGRPMIKRRIFEQLTELQEVDGWENLVPAVQDKLNQLLTTKSQVFSIFIVARKATSVDADTGEVPESPEEMRAEEERGDVLTRVVRCVVWRAKKNDEVVIVPIVRWEVLGYLPQEVLDFPEEER